MQASRVRAAIAEARRFIERAETALDSTETFDFCGEVTTDGASNAAAKRASMDLTRALAEMRKP